MGGLAGMIGHAAAGFEQARQQDLQRQFSDEQARRAMAGDFMQKVALDPNQHPDVRNAFLQSYMELSRMPMSKKFDLNKQLGPAFDLLAKYKQAGAGQQAGGLNAPPAPPPGLGIQGLPPVPPNAPALVAEGPTPNVPMARQEAVTPPLQGGGAQTFTPTLSAPPAPPEGMAGAAGPAAMLASPEDIARHTQLLAESQATGATTGQVGTTLAIHKAIADRLMADPRYAAMIEQDPMMRTMLLSAQLGVTMPYGMYAANMAGPSTTLTAGQARNDPSLRPLVPANIPDDSPVKVTRNRMGAPQSITEELVPSVLPKTTERGVTTPGGLTTTTKQTVAPKMPGGGSRLSAPPAPAAAGASGRAAGAAAKVPPAVAAAMDNIMLYGMPAGKMSDAQAIAIQEMKRQGIDPQIAATMSTRTMADKGRAILPLIQKARQLIAQDPKALGPLAGRWSELQQKYGNLTGPAKELDGTLISIYSIAGGMHGWRAIQVAGEFEKAYGTLSSNPASLNNGLDALQNTATTIAKVGYPGMPAPPAPPATTKPFNWDEHPVIK